MKLNGFYTFEDKLLMKLSVSIIYSLYTGLKYFSVTFNLDSLKKNLFVFTRKTYTFSSFSLLPYSFLVIMNINIANNRFNCLLLKLVKKKLFNRMLIYTLMDWTWHQKLANQEGVNEKICSFLSLIDLIYIEHSVWLYYISFV